MKLQFQSPFTFYCAHTKQTRAKQTLFALFEYIKSLCVVCVCVCHVMLVRSITLPFVTPKTSFASGLKAAHFSLNSPSFSLFLSLMLVYNLQQAHREVARSKLHQEEEKEETREREREQIKINFNVFAVIYYPDRTHKFACFF